jgi:hypothetical protein
MPEFANRRNWRIRHSRGSQGSNAHQTPNTCCAPLSVFGFYHDTLDIGISEVLTMYSVLQENALSTSRTNLAVNKTCDILSSVSILLEKKRW